ncbi:uncharacterized protein [Palaemon carinicauda]|uniref:uncharacterized protein n=1 Tax=Palaemon carinicauda TaxID=392227 RepID=UPI0035B5B780
MDSTEDFESRFLSFFHGIEDFPSPNVKTRDSFIYPSHLKASNKRRAPSPPSQTRKTEVNPYLVNVNQLGPVLKKYATIPRKSTDTARVILTTEKTKLKASSSTSALRSMLRGNISFSTKFDQGMFKTGLKGKNKSSVGIPVSHDVLINRGFDNPIPCAATAEEFNQAKVESICCKSEREYDLHQERKVDVRENNGTFSNETYYPTASNFTQRPENPSDQSNIGADNMITSNECNSQRETPFSLPESHPSSSESVQNILTKKPSKLGNSHPACHQSGKNVFEKSGRVNDMKCSEMELPSYYVKQSPIYEEVHMSPPLARVPDSSQSPLHRPSSDVELDPQDVRVDVPPAPANSPVISSPLKPKASNQCGTLNKDCSRKKKTPPPKPPRKRSLLANVETENALLPVGLQNHQRTYSNESFQLDGNWLMTSKNNSKFETEVEAHGQRRKLEQYYIESSLEKSPPKQAQVNSFPSAPPDSSNNASALGIEPHKNHSRKKKNTRKSAQSRAQQLSKSFRYLLVTKFGDFKLTGTTQFSRGKEAPARNSRSSKRASFLSVREQMRPRSPTPKRVNSIRIPRVIIDCSPSGYESDSHSDDLGISARKETNELCQSSVTSCVSPKAKVETAFSSAGDECHDKICTLCTSLGFHEHYNSDDDNYINASSESNLNQCWKVCPQSPEKKTRLC